MPRKRNDEMVPVTVHVEAKVKSQLDAIAQHKGVKVGVDLSTLLGEYAETHIEEAVKALQDSAAGLL